MIKLMSTLLITAGLLITTAPTVTAISETVKLTGKSVIYDAKHSKYTVFFTDTNYREYTYQVKGVKSNRMMQLFKRSFVNNSVFVKINERGRIISNLIP